MDPTQLLRLILRSHAEHLGAWWLSSSLKSSPPALPFQVGNCQRMTFDVAVRPSFSMAAAILFHTDGSIRKAWTQRSSTVDLLNGEAEAALLALSRASALDIKHLFLQGDSADVIESLRSAQLALLPPGPVLPWKITSPISSMLHL